MRTDRELLELAAKAAGVDASMLLASDFRKAWNPLADNGDALLLAATLSVRAPGGVLCLSIGQDRSACEFIYAYGQGDVAANTRRAIVLAAVAFGEAR